MKIQARAIHTDEINVTMNITMSLADWKDLQKDLPERYPHWKLSAAITSAIYKLDSTYNEEIETT